MTRRAQPETSLDRRHDVAILLEGRDDVLVVPGLGSATWDCAALGDNPLHFSLWGAMGNASMIGLGLALAQPARRVLVLTGDGDMLMGMGAFATIANYPVSNLAIVVLDNGRFGETGGQKTHTAAGVTDIEGIAKASGIPTTATICAPSDVETLKELAFRTPGPVVAVAKILYEDLKFVLPANSGSYLKDRFRNAILGEEKAQKG